MTPRMRNQLQQRASDVSAQAGILRDDIIACAQHILQRWGQLNLELNDGDDLTTKMDTHTLLAKLTTRFIRADVTLQRTSIQYSMRLSLPNNRFSSNFYFSIETKQLRNYRIATLTWRGTA